MFFHVFLIPPPRNLDDLLILLGLAAMLVIPFLILGWRLFRNKNSAASEDWKKGKISKDALDEKGPLFMGPFEKLNIDFLSFAKKIEEYFENIGFKVNISEIERLKTGEDAIRLGCAKSVLQRAGTHHPVLQIMIKGCPNNFSIVVNLRPVSGMTYLGTFLAWATKSSLHSILLFPDKDDPFVHRIPKFLDELKNSGDNSSD